MNRNIVVCIILSIVTCGIYGMYWMYKINEEMNAIAGNSDYTSGVVVIILTLVTCGIYGWFWWKKMGDIQVKDSGDGNWGIIYLVLALCGLSIVNYALTQSFINSKAAPVAA